MGKNVKKRSFGKPSPVKATFPKPEAAKHYDSADSALMTWKFDKIDEAGHFSFTVSREDFNAEFILSKIMAYSRKTWSEIKRATHDEGKSKHHFLEFDVLSREAKRRAEAKRLYEYGDSIFSLALTNKLRIIGIRNGEFFHAVWFDPNHEFCPSDKRHT
jgi:hypothetical protein